MQPLLGAIVEARNALKDEQTTDAEGKLIRESRRSVVRAEVEARVVIVVVQERHKKATGFAARADDVALQLFVMLEHAADFGGGKQSLGYSRKLEKERKVQGGIDTHQIALFGGMATDEARDLLLVIVHFTEGEEILLPDSEREFAHGVAEKLGEIGF